MLCREFDECEIDVDVRRSNRDVSIFERSSKLGQRCRRSTESESIGNDDNDDCGLLWPDAIEPPFCHGSK